MQWEIDQALRAEGYCAAINPKRDNKRCRSVCGAGTDHKGVGACKKHGGSAGRPAIHGRYASIRNSRIRELLDDDEEDEDDDPYDLVPDLHLARKLLADAINNYAETRDTAALLRVVASLADKAQKRRERAFWSSEALEWLLDAHGAVAYAEVRSHVSDPAVRDRILAAMEKGFSEIRIDPKLIPDDLAE